MEQQIIVPCLGRPMALGMLYDCRKDTPILGVTLWDANTLRNHSDIHSCESSEFHVTADDSMENKAHSLNVEAGVKLSFLGSMLNVEGAAKYLDNNRSSAYQARVVLKYSCKSSTEKLTMDHLGTENIKYHRVFDNDMATHVVTAIEYGADAIFVFDRRESSSESRREVEGKMKITLSKISVMKIASVDGVGSVQMNEEEKKLANGFTCTFHGDVVLKENPTTFDDALAIYKRLPILIRESTTQGRIYGVPKRAYLYPLSKLDNRAAKLVRSISNNVVYETQSIWEYIVHISAAANDLENSDICQKFWRIKQQVTKFKSLLSQFRSSFQSMLCEKLPKIRGGRMEESELLKEIKKIKNSAYDTTKLETWLDMKKREFACLQSYLEALKEFPTAFQAGELERYTQNNDLDYVLCFSFGNITSSENSFLDLMKKYLSSNENENTDMDMDKFEESWCNDDKVTADIHSDIRHFKNFAETNSDQKNIKFIIADASSKKDKNTAACSMTLFSKNGRQIFQLPSCPGKPQMVSITENEITISWTPPTVGVENVLFYRILYRPVGATDNSWSHVETEKLELEFTVKHLVSETEYLFKIEAVAEPGKSQAGPESSPIKTKSPPQKPCDIAVIQGTNRDKIITDVIHNCQNMNENATMLYHGLQAAFFVKNLAILSVCAPDPSLVTADMPTEEFKLFKTPISFRVLLCQIASNMLRAFDISSYCMDTIQDSVANSPDYFEVMLKIIDKMDNQKMKEIMKKISNKIENDSDKYKKAAENAVRAFSDPYVNIVELCQASIITENISTREVEEMEKLKKKLELRKNELRKFNNNRELTEITDQLKTINLKYVELKDVIKYLHKGVEYLEKVKQNWQKLSAFFDSIKVIVDKNLSENMEVFIKNAKEDVSRELMLQAALKAIGYCIQISNCAEIYTIISREYIMPIISGIDKEFALTEGQAIEEQSKIDTSLQHTIGDVESLIQQKQEEYRERAKEQMDIYADNLVKAMS